MADKRNKQGLKTIGARTVLPYGCYVKPRAAAGRRAALSDLLSTAWGLHY